MTDSAAPEVPPFEVFALDPRLLRALTDLGYVNPTPVQAEGIPHMLAGRDVIGRARTGSGKTAAFGLPLLHRLANTDGSGVRALILAPTRELALQVTAALRSYARHVRVGVVTVYGGASYAPQLKALREGVPIVVGTPGRLIDHVERGSLDLSGVEVVILDEADEMLRMGFIEEVQRLLALTPSTRQLALFSATMPAPIRAVAEAHLHDPIELQVERSGHSVGHIEQRFVTVPDKHKHEALVRILSGIVRGATLVFARTREGCAETAEMLSKRGFVADALHGDLNQVAREQVLGRFRARRLDVLVATDVAARGIDVEHVTHIVNLDLPNDVETYVHRIGRTGRAGRDGTAISFVTPAERRRRIGLEQRLKVRIEEIPVPSDADIARRQRHALQEDMRTALAGGETSRLAEQLSLLQAELDWTTHELAMAALELLAADRSITLDADLDEAPPAWARPEPRFGTTDGAFGKGPRVPSDHVEIIVHAGRQDGLRAADVVGALTNGVGMPGDLVGRVTITDRKAFVSMAQPVAQRLLATVSTLVLRGSEVGISLARPRTSRPEDRPPAKQFRDRDHARDTKRPPQRTGRTKRLG